MADELRTSVPTLSPTLAASFLGCSASVAWTLEAKRGLRRAAERPQDPQADLIVRKGHEHEQACLVALRDLYGDPFEIPKGSVEDGLAATREAMVRGVPLIYQAALSSGS